MRDSAADRYIFNHISGGAEMRRLQLLKRVKERLRHLWYQPQPALR